MLIYTKSRMPLREKIADLIDFFKISYSGLEIRLNICTQWERFHVAALISDGFWAITAYFQLTLKQIIFIAMFSGKFVL